MLLGCSWSQWLDVQLLESLPSWSSFMEPDSLPRMRINLGWRKCEVRWISSCSVMETRENFATANLRQAAVPAPATA